MIALLFANAGQCICRSMLGFLKKDSLYNGNLCWLILNSESVANTRLRPKTLCVTFLVVVSFVLIDVVVSSLVDVYRDFITSPTGISLDLAVTGVLVAGTYVTWFLI